MSDFPSPSSLSRSAHANIGTGELDMASLDQLRANRENAQLSTGPTSLSGKDISSANHIIHGLSGRTIVLKSENQADYDVLLDSIHAEYSPQTATEIELVIEIAGGSWRLRRADGVETRLFDQAGDDILLVTAELDKVRRYRTSIEKAWHKAIEQLRKIQAERIARPAPDPEPSSKQRMQMFDKALRDCLFAPLPSEIGFESQDLDEDEEAEETSSEVES